MKERLVVLSKLGQGASSVVYKALDLQDMRLVALKMIHVHDKDKRSQLVKEVCALFSLIKKENSRKSVHSSFNGGSIITPSPMDTSTNNNNSVDSSTHGNNYVDFRPERFIVDFYDAFR
jgi:serine/threonine protein kinase